ncbi:MAG: nitroreductase [Deltaproteobacteria bacterium]|nr:nitroreductase [Deltaproteobacteria bacterium]
MLNRRAFIKGALSAGFVLGSAATLNGCSGLTRKDFPAFQEINSQKATLDKTARTILYHAGLAPSGHNSQPWHVRIESSDSWMIEADAKRRLPCVDSQNRELMLSLGAFVENLSLAAGANGVGTDIQVIARDPHDRNVIRVVLHKDRPSDYPLQRIKKRRTVKHGHLPKEISAADIKGLSERIGNHLFYFPRGSNHAACMREAAVENYRVQARRDDAQQELVRWLRFNTRDAKQHRDGLTTHGMEILGFKGWMVRQFIQPEDFMKETYRQQGIDLIAQLAQEGGGWLVITSPGQTVANLIDTGRRFERMALLAREHRIGIHPMTQMLEEKSGLAQIAGFHGSGFFPQFVLRVGYLEKYPEPVSLRRPVDWFVTT